MESSDNERLEQIIRVDAHALLKTIRDLEYKISEHHRLEKSPPWAAALESRIDLLEKRYFAIADTKSCYGDERGTDLNFEEMSHDERVISKVRTEMDSKIDTSRTMTESKLLSTNLEIDRIHKIIQLRPTTSDMQQVMLAVHEIEKKTLTSVDAFSAKIDTLVEEKFSAELSHILEQLEATRGITEHSSELMQKQMAEAAREMTQVQMAFQNSFEKVKSEIATTNNAADRVTAQIAALDDKYKNVTDAMQEKHSELSKALESNLALINSNDAGAQKMFAALEKRMGEDHEQLYGELLSTISKMNTMQTEAKLLESNLSKLKMTYETDLQGLKTTITDSNSKLSQVQTKMKEMNAILHELMNYDYTGQLAKHGDSISKNTFDIMDLKNQVNTTIKEDIAAVTSAIATMKEELGKVPQSFADVTQKIRDLRTTDRAMEEELHKLDERLIAADTTVTGLLPLKVRVVNLENTSILTDKEVESLRETVTSNIDESEELRGRVTELEDSMKDFDENIEGRMNMIRDTLMDTILEKQTETNDTMRNVRENLELMSMAGDPGSGGGGGGAGGTGSVMSRQKSIGSMRGGDPMAAGTFMGMGSALGGGSQAGSRGSAFIPGRGGGSLSSRQDLSGTTLRGAPPPATGRQSTSMGSVASRQPSMRGSGGGDGYGGDLSSASAGTAQSSQRGSVAMPARRGTLNRRSGGGGSIISGGGHISQPSLDSQESYMSGASSGSSGAGMNARGVPGARGSIMKPARTSLQVSTPSANTDHSVNEEDEDEYEGEDGEAAGQRIKRVQSTPLSPMSARGEVEADEGQEQGEKGSRPSSVEGINSDGVGNGNARSGKNGGKVSHHVVSFSKLDSDDDDPYRSRSPGGGNSPSAPVVILPPETSANAAQFAEIMGVEGEYVLYNQAQFISDLCINFEEISVKRKRIEGIPPVMCENIAAVTQELAEFIARSADSEMVQTMLLKAAAHSVATNMITAVFDEATYDESFVINRRQQKISEYVDYVTAFVAQNNPQPGIIRMDARTIFISALSKALDMFMSKHNQVLVVGNSRLGRIKIPSCIACDRPLVEKVRLENGGAGDVLHPRGALAAGSSAYGVGEEGFSMHDALDFSSRGGRNATSPDKAVMLVNIQQNHIYNNGPSGTTDNDHGGDSSHNNQKRRKMAGAGGKMGMSQSTGTLKLPRAKMHKNSNHAFRPQTSAESMSEEAAQAYVMRGGFKMPRDRPSSVQFAGENASGGHGNGNGQKQGFLPQVHQ